GGAEILLIFVYLQGEFTIASERVAWLIFPSFRISTGEFAFSVKRILSVSIIAVLQPKKKRLIESGIELNNAKFCRALPIKRIYYGGVQ
ncbi:MAG: hypothetical protein LZF61_01180, partial [Nitrosomonas sp.]